MEREPLLLACDESCDEEDVLVSNDDDTFANGIDSAVDAGDDSEHGTVTLRHGDGVNEGFTATCKRSNFY